jgi:hypothetical protein
LHPVGDYVGSRPNAPAPSPNARCQNSTVTSVVGLVGQAAQPRGILHAVKIERGAVAGFNVANSSIAPTLVPKALGHAAK